MLHPPPLRRPRPAPAKPDAARSPPSQRPTRHAWAKLVADIWTALGEQAVTVPGTAAADTVLPRLADSLKTVPQQRSQVAPTTRESGTSINGEPHQSRQPQTQTSLLPRRLRPLSDSTSKAYYQRKREESKKHNAALICLARRRCDVLYAMLRNRNPQPAPASGKA